MRERVVIAAPSEREKREAGLEQELDRLRGSVAGMAEPPPEREEQPEEQLDQVRRAIHGLVVAEELELAVAPALGTGRPACAGGGRFLAARRAGRGLALFVPLIARLAPAQAVQEAAQPAPAGIACAAAAIAVEDVEEIVEHEKRTFRGRPKTLAASKKWTRQSLTGRRCGDLACKAGAEARDDDLAIRSRTSAGYSP
jgi:hypothetical protein